MDCLKRADLERAAIEIVCLGLDYKTPSRTEAMPDHLTEIVHHAQGCERCMEWLDHYAAIETRFKEYTKNSEIIIPLLPAKREARRSPGASTVPEIEEMLYAVAADSPDGGSTTALPGRLPSLVSPDERFLINAYIDDAGDLEIRLLDFQPEDRTESAIPQLRLLRVAGIDYPFDRDGIVKLRSTSLEAIQLVLKEIHPL